MLREKSQITKFRAKKVERYIGTVKAYYMIEVCLNTCFMHNDDIFYELNFCGEAVVLHMLELEYWAGQTKFDSMCCIYIIIYILLHKSINSSTTGNFIEMSMMTVVRYV